MGRKYIVAERQTSRVVGSVYLSQIMVRYHVTLLFTNLFIQPFVNYYYTIWIYVGIQKKDKKMKPYIVT